jgi:hypothetical protein
VSSPVGVCALRRAASTRVSTSRSLQARQGASPRCRRSSTERYDTPAFVREMRRGRFKIAPVYLAALPPRDPRADGLPQRASSEAGFDPAVAVLDGPLGLKPEGWLTLARIQAEIDALSPTVGGRVRLRLIHGLVRAGNRWLDDCLRIQRKLERGRRQDYSSSQLVVPCACPNGRDE